MPRPALADRSLVRSERVEIRVTPGELVSLRCAADLFAGGNLSRYLMGLHFEAERRLRKNLRNEFGGPA